MWGPCRPAAGLAATVIVAVLAQVSATGTAVQPRSWMRAGSSNSCLQLTGAITIRRGDVQEQVPEDAEVTGYCDGSPVMSYHWAENKALNVFLQLDQGSQTFNVEQVQYSEGTDTWHADVSGFRGHFGGEVKCAHETIIHMKRDERPNGPTEAPTTAASSGDLTTATAATQDATTATQPDSTPGADQGSTATSGDQEAGDGQGGQSTEGTRSRARLGEHVSLEDNPSSPEERFIVLTQVSVKYTTGDINNESLFVSGCRVEPDLTLTLGVSGAATAAALLTIMAVATRVFC